MQSMNKIGQSGGKLKSAARPYFYVGGFAIFRVINWYQLLLKKVDTKYRFSIIYVSSIS